MVDDYEEIFWKKKINQIEDEKYSKLAYAKRKFFAYFVAARIPTIIIVIAFLLLGEWYAVSYFPTNQTILMIIFLLLVQFINGLTNFTFDKKLDIFARKHTVWVFKYISSKEMLVSSAIFSFIGISILWYYFDLKTFIVGVLLVLTTIFYAMSPIRLKTKPPLDSISNMLMLGSIPFFLGWMATSKQLDSNAIIYGLIMGMAVVVYYLIISWQDVKTDVEFGIKTSCVMLGYDWTIYSSIILWIILIVVSIFTFHLDISTFSFLIAFPFLIILLIKYRQITDYQIRQKNLSFYLSITTFIWICFISLSLSFLTISIIPVIFLVIEITLFLKGLLNKNVRINKN